MINNEFKFICDLIDKNYLFFDFKYWSLKEDSKDGDTITHYAASHKKLSIDFIQTFPILFITPNNFKVTPAHYYATYAQLPNSFPHWYVKDHIDQTVAHTAAMSNNLPTGFQIFHPGIWTMPNSHGQTVSDYC